MCSLHVYKCTLGTQWMQVSEVSKSGPWTESTSPLAEKTAHSYKKQSWTADSLSSVGEKWGAFLRRMCFCGQSLVQVHCDWACCVFCWTDDAQVPDSCGWGPHHSGGLLLFCSNVLPLASVRTLLGGPLSPLSGGRGILLLTFKYTFSTTT